MHLDASTRTDALARLRRAHGQLAAVIRMIESDRDCEDVLTQLAACSHAISRTGYRLVANGMARCAAGEGSSDGMTTERLERLFLALG